MACFDRCHSVSKLRNKHLHFFPPNLHSVLVPHDLWYHLKWNTSRSKNLYCNYSRRFFSCCWKTKSLRSENGKGQMKARYCVTFVRTLRLSKGSPFSGCCPQRLFSKMAGTGEFKDFGPLVGAIDQGTSSSRFLVRSKFLLRNGCAYCFVK